MDGIPEVVTEPVSECRPVGIEIELLDCVVGVSLPMNGDGLDSVVERRSDAMDVGSPFPVDVSAFAWKRISNQSKNSKTPMDQERAAIEEL